MDTTEITHLLSRLLDEYGQGPADREEIRVWERSGVERLRLASGATVVFKYAEGPFADEHIALDVAQRGGLYVAERLAVVRVQDALGMLLTDLGPAVREATDAEGAALAVTVHRIGDTGSLTVVGESQLAAMPGQIAAQMRVQGFDCSALQIARDLNEAAADRARRAGLAPFGLCHSEWHPTSVHIGDARTHLLDFARAFRGPGLLDLASWHGTIADPNPDQLHETIHAYVNAGGPETALQDRGGLPAARWALGWHRLWVADWFTHQMTIGWARGAEEAWANAITRHLTEAAHLLNT